jgi:hypothetical protein
MNTEQSCEEKIKKSLNDLIKKESSKEYEDRLINGSEIISKNLSLYWFGTGYMEETLYGTWRQLQDRNQFVLFAEREDEDKVVKMTTEHLQNDPSVKDCNCSVIKSKFEIILEGEYGSNDAYSFKPIESESESESKWFFTKWYNNNIVNKEPHMLFEDQKTNYNGISVVWNPHKVITPVVATSATSATSVEATNNAIKHVLEMCYL